jgi:hypothetical protein
MVVAPALGAALYVQRQVERTRRVCSRPRAKKSSAAVVEREQTQEIFGDVAGLSAVRTDDRRSCADAWVRTLRKK